MVHTKKERDTHKQGGGLLFAITDERKERAR